MNNKKIAIVVYGETGSSRNILAEEKYNGLCDAFEMNDFHVTPVLYNDSLADHLSDELMSYDGILVWINPIEQGHNRNKLDAMLTGLAKSGCYVSAHPEVILKMGTKEVLFKTKAMEWGGDINLYTGYSDFINRFPHSLEKTGTRVLKQYRGNGGNGVFKIISGPQKDQIIVVHAKDSTQKRILHQEEFYQEFEKLFSNNEILIDQEWNNNITNGMVRCYISGTKVAGFGYQEINALYELKGVTNSPGKRYYYTENCGLFSDLREIMENKWVPELISGLAIDKNKLPVIWDADFFINDPNDPNTSKKYSLCEINVSCVSPFPPGAINYIVEEVSKRINKLGMPE